MSMDADKFLRDYNRMCTGRACADCEISKAKVGSNAVTCVEFLRTYPSVAIKIVERWSQEHPVRTRQSEFLEQWPNASKGISGVLSITPCSLDSSRKKKCSEYRDCNECRRAFWNAEVW